MSKSKKFVEVACCNEAACIGCTKCLEACPVDAIIGAFQMMHTVIQEECIGCRLCVAPCPVDCIQIIPYSTLENPLKKVARARERVRARKERLLKQTEVKEQIRLKAENISKKEVIREILKRTQVAFANY